MNTAIAERFWSKVAKDPDGCWIYNGLIQSNGYGIFYARNWIEGKRRFLAHRAAYALTNGHVPDAAEVCHRCDNRQCVRPDHLFLGTHSDNMADAAHKGRLLIPDAVGEQNGFAKLTLEQVREIKARYVPGRVTQARLAREFGVSADAIQKIVTGKNWRHA